MPVYSWIPQEHCVCSYGVRDLPWKETTFLPNMSSSCQGCSWCILPLQIIKFQDKLNKSIKKLEKARFLPTKVLPVVDHCHLLITTNVMMITSKCSRKSITGQSSYRITSFQESNYTSSMLVANQLRLCMYLKIVLL